MLDTVGLAELGAQARRNEIQGRFAQRRALDRVQRALVGAAVLLEPALQQDRERRLAARGRPEQQQQPPSDVRAGRRRLEVVDHATERLVDAEQLALEELARLLSVVCLRSRGRARAACPRCIRGWCECRPRGASARMSVRKSLRRAFPALRAMLLAELVQRIQEIREDWTPLLAVILPSSNLRSGIGLGH